MTHAEFVAAHRIGKPQIRLDPQRAARFLSARLLLPLVMMPLIGVGIALAITGSAWLGLTVIAFTIIVPRLIKRSAPRFLLTQALDDEKLYVELQRSGVIEIDD